MAYAVLVGDLIHFLDPGEFQRGESPVPNAETKKKEKPKTQSESSDKLSGAILQQPSLTPPKKKEPEKAKGADRGAPEKETSENVIEQIKEDMSGFRKLLNPFGWGR